MKSWGLLRVSTRNGLDPCQSYVIALLHVIKTLFLRHISAYTTKPDYEGSKVKYRAHQWPWKLAALVLAISIATSSETYAQSYPRGVQSSSEWIERVAESIPRCEDRGFGWAVVEFTVASLTTDAYAGGNRLFATEIQPEDLMVHAGQVAESARIMTRVMIIQHPVRGVVTVGYLKGPGAQYWVAPGNRVMALVYGLANGSPLRNDYPDTADVWTAWLIGQVHDGQLSVVTEVATDYEPISDQTLARVDLSTFMSQVIPTSWAGASVSLDHAIKRIRASVLEVQEQ